MQQKFEKSELSPFIRFVRRIVSPYTVEAIQNRTDYLVHGPDISCVTDKRDFQNLADARRKCYSLRSAAVCSYPTHSLDLRDRPQR